jgi:arylsulfatase B
MLSLLVGALLAATGAGATTASADTCADTSKWITGYGSSIHPERIVPENSTAACCAACAANPACAFFVFTGGAGAPPEAGAVRSRCHLKLAPYDAAKNVPDAKYTLGLVARPPPPPPPPPAPWPPPGPPVPGEGTKPHLVFAMIDDWGWYDNGFHGNSVIKTPFLDAMVRNDALLLERHYVFKYCSPTRRSFLSGRVPPHSGQANGADVTVDTRMHTIAAKLKQAGYRTGMSGKWHAGHMLVKQQPHGVGFDTSLGYMNGACDHYTQIDGEDGCAKQGGGPTTDIWNTDRPGVGLNGTYGDLMYVGRAVETIMQHDVGEKAHPLFYYLAMQCAHDPMEAPQRFLDIYAKDDFCGNGGKSKCTMQTEYAFSSVIDEGISNVTKALKAKSMWDNTLLVVASDNGGPAFSDQQAASNFPLRGGKYQLWEGGIRGNAFVTGGLLPAAMRGRNLSAAVHVCDWYSTFANLAGVNPADDAPGIPSIDSINQWSVISGKSSSAARVEIWPADGILINGSLKLIATGPGTGKWSGPLYPKVPAENSTVVTCSEKAPCLYDVVADPSERADIAAGHPDVVARMAARLAALAPTKFSGQCNECPKDGSAQICAQTAKNGGYLTPVDWVAPPP